MRYRYEDEGYREGERRARDQEWEEDERRRGTWGRGSYAGGQGYGHGYGGGYGQGRERYGERYGERWGEAAERPRPYGREEERGGYFRDWDNPWEHERAIPSRVRRESAGYGGYGNYGPYGSYGEHGWMGRDLGREQERPYYGSGRGPFGQPERAPMREEMRERGERGSWMEGREGLGERVARGLRNWFGLGPKGYRRSDERIREDVCDRLVHLAQHAEVDSSDVEVEVREGEVSLRGAVRERRWKHVIEDVADSVPGVRDVHNQLRVRREGRETDQTPEERRGTTGATANNPQDTTRTGVSNNGPGSRGPQR